MGVDDAHLRVNDALVGLEPAALRLLAELAATTPQTLNILKSFSANSCEIFAILWIPVSVTQTLTNAIVLTLKFIHLMVGFQT